MFPDRAAGGRALAGLLRQYQNRSDVIVLALPRGGVPVAYEVARALAVPLDLLVVRKLGVPIQPELAMGAVASGGAVYLNEDIVRLARVSPAQIDVVLAQEREELRRREQLYRGDRPPLDVRGKTVIVVDDGLATGASMRAALAALKTLAPARSIVAVPVAPPDTADQLAALADEVVCVLTPFDFHAVGQFYQHFTQTTDAEVRDLLARAQGEEA